MADMNPGIPHESGSHIPPPGLAGANLGSGFPVPSREAGASRGESIPPQTPLYQRPDEMWQKLGVPNLAAAIGENLPLGPLAQRHLEEHPFESHRSRIRKDSMLWYEGSYDPIGVHHFKIFCDTIRALDFQRATLAIVYKHPVKTMLAYEHRYEMAKSVLETAGFTVVDDFGKDGICLLPPGSDGLNRFHVARLEALYNPKNFILIGPDNFDRALETNILWTHIDGVKDSVSGRARYGFRAMYDGGIAGLKDRLVVYPYLNSVHSTDIRKGEVPMLGPVRDYVEQHGLYHAGAVVTAPAKLSTGAAPKTPYFEMRDGATTLAEMTHRADLLVTVGLGFPWSFNESKAMYQAVLGAADRSELRDLINAVEKCRIRSSTTADGPTSPSSARYLFDKRITLANEILGAMSATVIGGDIQIQGVENLVEAHDIPGARIVLVANESGWGDIPVLTHALRTCRLAGLAENLTFVYSRDVFENAAIAGLVGHAANVIKPTANLAASPADVQARVNQAALERGLEQLSLGGVVLFPENNIAQRGAYELANMGPECIRALKSYIKTNKDPDISAEKVFIVPVGIVGGSDLNAQRSHAPFSTDHPAVVQFGRAIPLSTVLDAANKHSEEIAGHVIGHRIAALLPTEWRGAYATGAAESQAQESAARIAETLLEGQPE